MVKRVRQMIVAGVVLATIATASAFSATPASAEPLPVVCTAAGLVTVTPSFAGTAWAVSGAGSCYGDFNGTYVMSLQGAGTSDNIGLCGDSGYVNDLRLSVNVTLTNVLTQVPRNHVQTWGAPYTTFPVATPFSIREGGANTGGGVMFTRVFAKCPTEGSPVATFDFSFIP